MRPPSKEKLEAAVKEFNERFQVGTEVEYCSITGFAPEHTRRTRVRKVAFVLGGHTACAFVEGVTGCVNIECIRRAF